MIEVASLRYGVIFKKVFSKPHIFTAFVKDMLGIDIDKVETEKSFTPVIGNVDSRFDLFAQNKKTTLIHKYNTLINIMYFLNLMAVTLRLLEIIFERLSYDFHYT